MNQWRVWSYGRKGVMQTCVFCKDKATAAARFNRAFKNQKVSGVCAPEEEALLRKLKRQSEQMLCVKK